MNELIFCFIDFGKKINGFTLGELIPAYKKQREY